MNQISQRHRPVSMNSNMRSNVAHCSPTSISVEAADATEEVDASETARRWLPFFSATRVSMPTPAKQKHGGVVPHGFSVKIKLRASALVTLSCHATTPPVEPKCAPLTNLQGGRDIEQHALRWRRKGGVCIHEQLVGRRNQRLWHARDVQLRLRSWQLLQRMVQKFPHLKHKRSHSPKRKGTLMGRDVRIQKIHKGRTVRPPLLHWFQGSTGP
jgi:hypothetical protein